MNTQKVVVIIPVHLPEPSEIEKVSLTQTLSVLHRFPIIFMAPLALDVSWYIDYCGDKKDVSTERFDWYGYDAYSILQTKFFFISVFSVINTCLPAIWMPLYFVMN